MTNQKRILLGLLLLLGVAGGAYFLFPGEFSGILPGLTGGGAPPVIAQGSRVFGRYSIKSVANGTLLMDSGNAVKGRGLVVGKGEILPEFEQALIGKTVGFTHSIRITLSDLKKTPMGAQVPETLPIPDDLLLEIQGTVLEVQN